MSLNLYVSEVMVPGMKADCLVFYNPLSYDLILVDLLRFKREVLP